MRNKVIQVFEKMLTRKSDEKTHTNLPKFPRKKFEPDQEEDWEYDLNDFPSLNLKDLDFK